MAYHVAQKGSTLIPRIVRTLQQGVLAIDSTGARRYPSYEAALLAEDPEGYRRYRAQVAEHFESCCEALDAIDPSHED